jgi:hypothetical protein
VLRLLMTILLLTALCQVSLTQSSSSLDEALREHNPRLLDFPVIEFRRYTIKEGRREAFTQYFDTYFPEAFQQLGTIVSASMLERKNQSGFIWIKGFHTLDERAVLNGSFYFSSVWNEHRSTMTDLIANADNVMLLGPLRPETGVPVLGAVDPVKEPRGAQGVVVVQVFSVKSGRMEDFAREAEPVFASFRATKAREAGVLVTLDVKNNFPLLSFRTDGPFLVWIGLLENNKALETDFMPVAERSLGKLNATGLLREAPELIILDPTPRSRLRWVP